MLKRRSITLYYIGHQYASIYNFAIVIHTMNNDINIKIKKKLFNKPIPITELL